MLQLRNDTNIWEKLSLPYFSSFSWKDLWSAGMIKRQRPVCLTSIHLLCYFNDSNSFGHVALPPQTIIRGPCQEIKRPLWVAIIDAEESQSRDKERKLTHRCADIHWLMTTSQKFVTGRHHGSGEEKAWHGELICVSTPTVFELVCQHWWYQFEMASCRTNEL